MSRFRPFAPRNALLGARLLFGVAGGVFLLVPVAAATSPAAGATWKAADDSGDSGNPFRAKMEAQWAPVRSQQAAAGQSAPNVDRDTQSQLLNSSPRVAPGRPVIKPVQNAVAGPSTASQKQQWRLPNGQTAASRPPNTPPAMQSAGREPRPFNAPANATRLAASAERNQLAGPQRRGTVASHMAPPQRPPQASSAAQSSASAQRAPDAPSYRRQDGSRMAMNPRGGSQRSQTVRGARPNSRSSNSYSSRMWDTINVAFEDPAAWMEDAVEPESLPMPSGSDQGGPSMGGSDYYDPSYGGPGGCSDGSCSPNGGGCACPGGCADCGTMCGDGMCGCEPGCGCGCGAACEPGCGCPNGQCPHECDLNCIGPGDDAACQTVRIGIPRWQDLQVFGGVQGFKGPYDRERDSGNFGFNEGFNTGFKLPYTPLGYQLGYRAVHSQLHGDKDTGIGDPHTQQFLTAGVFQRARDGLQYGIAWDFLRDERWGAVDFHQLRGELSLVDRGCHEWGLAAAVHLNQHEPFPADEETPSVMYQSTDQYLLFYRFHGRRGGEGRFYGGFNDDSDGILGAEMLLPLQDRWSLQAGFTYLIPDESGGEIGAQQEAWNIGLALVWHWDCAARKCHSNCYRPLFNVADNGSMIIDDRLGAAVVNGNDE